MKLKFADILPQEPLPVDEWNSPIVISITIAACQCHALKQLCQYFGKPGTAPAAMAATAFTRGLAQILIETSCAWQPDGRMPVTALTKANN